MGQLPPWVEGIGQDIRFAVRTLSTAPIFTIVAIVSIAIGIGANTAIFTLIDAVMWRLLPVKNPQTLMLLVRTRGDAAQQGFSYQEYHQMREYSRFATLAAYSPLLLSVSVNGDVEPAIEGQLVSGNYFSLLGVPAAAGRTIGVDDDRVPNGHPVAMISYGYGRRRFGLAAAAIGKTILISGTPFTIIGVTPREFFGTEVGTASDVFVPLMMQPTVEPEFENLIENPIAYRTWCITLGRLKRGASPQATASALEALYRQVTPPVGHRIGAVNWNVSLKPAATGLSDLRRQFSEALFILMLVVGAVLLIACANLANLLLARAAVRRAEFAMRLALGAGRGRLISQLIVESLVLSISGGFCGILLARWIITLLVTYMASGRGAITLDMSPDVRMLCFTAGISILTAVLFGLAPALRGTRVDLTTALKGLGKFSRPPGSLRPGKILVVFQIAISLVLVMGAELFVRTLKNLNGPEASDRGNVVMVRVDPPGSDQRNVPGTSLRLDAIYRGLIERVRFIPGVRAVGMSQVTPTEPGSDGGPLPFPSGVQELVRLVMVYPSYFSTVGIPVVAGREFKKSDLRENSPAVCIVNETFAREMFPGENPVGKPCATLFRPSANDVAQRRYGSPPIPYETIGVVQDSRYMNPNGSIPPMIYTPFLQASTGRGQMVLYVRVAKNSGAVLRHIRAAILSVDPRLPSFQIHSLAQEMDAALVRERLIATLSSVFGVLALALACLGIYSLLAFAVVQRTGEVGVRMALGAAGGDVLSMILREALCLALAGIVIGIPAAVVAGILSSSRIPGLLFGLSVTDPTLLASAVTIMLIVTVLAAFLPAWRASHIDPMAALRNE